MELQPLAFPYPFDPDLLWKPNQLEKHLEKFPDGQFVAEDSGLIVGSCSNSRISVHCWNEGCQWEDIVGGHDLSTFDPEGEIMFGMDISVHPNYQRRGIGRGFYCAREEACALLGIKKFVTLSRMPDFRESQVSDPQVYVAEVKAKVRKDRTLSPIFSYGMTLVSVVENAMDDSESRNFGCKFEKCISNH